MKTMAGADKVSTEPKTRKETPEKKQKIRVKIYGYDYAAVDAACGRVKEVAERNGARIAGPVPMPTTREVVTVIRSPHKYKDSREQFETRTHKRLIDIYNPNQKVVEALTRLEMPAGVEIQIKL
jgi:small subunit ribosomal protein S10